MHDSDNAQRPNAYIDGIVPPAEGPMTDEKPKQRVESAAPQQNATANLEHGLGGEQPPEQPVQIGVSAGDEYSVLTTTQKKCVVLTASLASVFSPMATSIYYPSLDTIAKDLNVSNAKINITITLFLVIQGIAPSFVADLADKTGRRPMYIVCYIIFTAANIGLALQNSYVPLLILRMIQSSGSSGTVALANGVVGDIITSAERGTYIAFASVGGILAPTIAPVIGGLLGQYAGWHFIFWFLVIFSAAVFIPLILFLPETCRNVVDNGTIPAPLLSRNITDTIRHRRRNKAGLTFNEAKNAELSKNYRWRAPNPLSTLKVILDPESACILVTTGLGLGCFYAVSTGASDVFTKVYGFNQLKISLMFVPVGIGSLISVFTTGKIVDWNYRRHAKKLGIPVVKNRRQDLTNFPIEKARLQIAFPFAFIAGAFVIAYGWIMAQKLTLAAPIIALFLTGYSLTSSFQVLNILMVDIHPSKPSVATAANNFVRCEIGAVFSAIILPLTDAVGIGWAYTILALIFMVFNPVLLVIMRQGPKWRKERKEKEDRASAAKKDKADRLGERRA
ncbi:MFS general substrate transporter [Venustampulla echinocandica]|uniref:MFS general substrate transporter n=1 Tax=Venustampulla echinocandica TaxID=2656787 RepID=A0A370T8X3_9HELO|nr:MFS general substrate transporter [Venustampulla echinocandica]RDL29943.1 MFS general substrate transporter [Venustampulla echinocandica]